jgi:hypothetical protein
MLRRVLLVVMATVVSYLLTACGGYILYTISEGRSEAHLALMARLLFNPLIALAVGVLVGLLSSDRPALTSVVGLTPWALMLRGPGRGGSVSGLSAFLGGMLFYFALGAVAAAFVWRLRHKSAE